LRSNKKGYGGKAHYTESQNSDTTAPSGRELYHLQFSLQVASPETFGYTLVCMCNSAVHEVSQQPTNDKKTNYSPLLYLVKTHTASEKRFK
jgi:hypothetical protein